MAKKSSDVEVVLVTGAEGFLGRRMAGWLLANRVDAVVVLLCQPGREVEVHSFVGSLPETQALRCRVVTGSVTSMDIGLTSDEYRQLSKDVTEILHLDERSRGSRRALHAQNVEGTRELLDFAGSCQRLRRYCHLSSVEVSGDRHGVVMEDELDLGQKFLDAYQKTKFDAEKLVVRWSRRIPVTVVRAGLVVGDTRNGEMDQGSLGFRVIASMARGTRPTVGEAPFHVVPWDYLIEAMGRLAFDSAAVSRTFHVADPTPLSAKRAVDLLARIAHKKQDATSLPEAVRRLLPRMPLVAPLVRSKMDGLPGFLNTMVFYNSKNRVRLLGAKGVICPGLDDYAEVLVRFLRQVETQSRREAMESVTDPLE